MLGNMLSMASKRVVRYCGLRFRPVRARTMRKLVRAKSSASRAIGCTVKGSECQLHDPLAMGGGFCALVLRLGAGSRRCLEDFMHHVPCKG